MSIDRSRAEVCAVEKHLQPGGPFDFGRIALRLSRRFLMSARFFAGLGRDAKGGDHCGDEGESKKNLHILASS
jgi:hypothetical protein